MNEQKFLEELTELCNRYRIKLVDESWGCYGGGEIVTEEMGVDDEPLTPDNVIG